MEKSFWGPSTWSMIHSSTANYKPIYRTSFKQFIYSLPYLLPCQYCREHLKENLKNLSPENYLYSSEQLFLWSYLLHDKVNRQLGKTSPDYNIVRNHYIHSHKNTFWGPYFWRAIHSFAASYRPSLEVKTAFKQFIYSLIGIIPCDECRDSFTRFLVQLPLTEVYLTNAHSLFLWTYLLHDLVNKKINKTSPPFDVIKAQYFNNNVCSSCGV